MSEIRMNCLHTSISNWGTPQARCDACGATFDWRGRDPMKDAQRIIDGMSEHDRERLISALRRNERTIADP